MRILIITDNEAGQRLDHFLLKFLPGAPASFFYKMLRKKNITVNGKKAGGSERLAAGDELKLFLSEETIEKFSEKRYAGGDRHCKRNSWESPSLRSNSGQLSSVKSDTGDPSSGNSNTRNLSSGKSDSGDPSSGRSNAGKKISAGSSLPPLDIIYEDDDIIAVNKPVGVLSQKAKPEDVSLNEQIVSYLVDSGQLSEADMRAFRPGVCNRLDRNTSGIVVAGKTLAGLQALSAMLRDRSVQKLYLALVRGEGIPAAHVTGYLVKDEAANKVTVYTAREDVPESAAASAAKIETRYRPIASGRGFSLLEVELLTGRTHQIRSQLASEGHPVLGDVKYGDLQANRAFAGRISVRHQLLHSWKMIFPSEAHFAASGAGFRNSKEFMFSGVTVTAPLPEYFAKCLETLRIRVPEN